MLHIKKIITLSLSALFLASALLTTDCGEETGEEAHTHAWGEWETVTEATCVASGTKRRTCKDDPSHVETETIPADGNAHAWIAGEILETGSCTEKGTRAFTCAYDPSHETTMETYIHDFGDWERVESPTCNTAGLKKRVCKNGDATETAPIAARGHNYINGVCDECGDEAKIPDEEKEIVYLNPRQSSSGISGAGIPFDRYLMEEGYYEVEIGNSGSVWVSFNVESAGQYALYTLNAPDVTVKEYAASAQYIPEDENGEYVGTESRTMKDGNKLATVQCTEKYWSADWEGTFAFHGAKGTIVRFRFVRIGDPVWEPEYVYETVEAQELTEKAADAGAGKILKDVAFTSNYFYDETVGYYRTGTAENPGEIIYAAITANAPRLFEDCTIATIAATGNSYKLHYAETADGDYLLRDYSWFISSYGGIGSFDESETFIPENPDPDAVCYENYVNGDGVHPVTQELYEFLVDYTNNNLPISLIDGTEEEIENAWLAACFYYANATPGTESYPIEITEETTSVTTKLRSYIYYTFTLSKDSAETSFTISTTSENAFVAVNGTTYNGTEITTVTLKPGEKITLRIGTVSGAKETFDLIVKATE